MDENQMAYFEYLCSINGLEPVMAQLEGWSIEKLESMQTFAQQDAVDARHERDFRRTK